VAASDSYRVAILRLRRDYFAVAESFRWKG
jgi:hypothetical protein